MKYELNQVYNEDCVEAMKLMPDNYFDLAIVDPPYGILSKAGDRLDKYGTGHKDWDSNTPSDEYFMHLQRVSLHQIVWGGNYFPFLWRGGCKGFIFWFKHQPVTNWAAGELAWTSFNKPARCFDYMYYGNINAEHNRSHPTQKPVQLYKWLLDNYAKPNMKILDTHGGSCSSILAMIDFGCDWMCFETDKEYYDNAVKRINNHIRKPKIDFEQTGKTYTQLTID